MNCPSCQNPIQEGEKFCGKCGSPIKKNKALTALWTILLMMDILSVPLLFVFVILGGFAGMIFNDDGGFVFSSWMDDGMFYVGVGVVLLIANFILFIMKKPKIGIPLAIINALPILYVIFGTIAASLASLSN